MEFTADQATAAAEAAGIDLKNERFTAEALAAGMTAELEHGAESPDTDITNNDPILTGETCGGTPPQIAVLLCPEEGAESMGGFAREGGENQEHENRVQGPSIQGGRVRGRYWHFQRLRRRVRECGQRRRHHRAREPSRRQSPKAGSGSKSWPCITTAGFPLAALWN